MPNLYLRTAAFSFILILAGTGAHGSEPLRPGFDITEYRELLKVFSSFAEGRSSVPASERFRRIHRSEEVGLDNQWELHVDDAGTAVISIRGTTKSMVSWMGNVYAAMAPAKGGLILGEGRTFEYQLAEDPQAAVHTGWLLGMAYLQEDIMPKLDSLTRCGGRDLLIMGHSQGGGIAYLLTAHLHHLMETGALPEDLRIKTYCSAAPKPGNLYFAYELEHRTRGGWNFNVVYALDWVPEAPVSIQTMNDFNDSNPFVEGRSMMKRQPFFKRLVLKHMYGRLDKPTRKAQRRYERLLGRGVGKRIRKFLPNMEVSSYAQTTHYVRTGTTIVLMPDDDYMERFARTDAKGIFLHHGIHQYLFLAERYDGRPDRSSEVGAVH